VGDKVVNGGGDSI